MAPDAADARPIDAADVDFVVPGEEHVPLLLAWRSDPRLLEWFLGRDRPMDEAAVRRAYLSRGDSAVVRRIAAYRGLPVGAVSWYPAAGASIRDSGDGGGTWSVDLFVGDPSLWGRGLGTALAAALAAAVVEREGATEVVLTVHAGNPRAIRAYEKAGFVKRRLVLEAEVHEGTRRDCWVMEYRGERRGG